MCGIAGIVSYDASGMLVAETARMSASLAHRGPDDAGLLAFAPREAVAFALDRDGRRTALAPPDPAACASVALACRRLAIIDLSPAGHQPMVSTDGRHVIVLNGEIYNYLELRQELESLGHTFRSRSDTEVLLAAFGAWGAACLPRLVGMYAFAILDLSTRRLILARDPFGIKPLYYVALRSTLAFASEIPPLLPLLAGDVRARPQRVHDFLDSGITDHGADTMYADVQALPPAHYAVVDLQHPAEVAPLPFWRPNLDHTLDLSFDQAARRLRELFLESVTLHLRSDVRVGVMLSGGLDSSSVAMAMRYIGGRSVDIHTFSYIGDLGAANETPWIDLVNRAAGAVPHKLELERSEWAGDLDVLLRAHGEPFRTPAVYAQFRLCRLARDTGVTVLLSGHGSDELLAGYSYLWPARLASLLRQRAPIRAAGLLRSLAHARRPGGPSIRGITLKGIAAALPPSWVAAALRIAGRAQRPWIAHDWTRRHGLAPRTPWWSGSRGRYVLREALWLALTARSIPSQLRYQDRHSMAHSLEERVPYLTPPLAEFLLALPEEYLLGSDGSTKTVFRAAMRGIVPDAILDRPVKVGFSVPIHAWLPALPTLPALLEAAARLPPVAASEVRRVLDRMRQSAPVEDITFGQALRDGTDGAHRAWWLANLAAWSEQFGVQVA